MSRQVLLSLQPAAEFLKGIYPEQNWVLFLSKNLHGLTEGYAPIPCDMNASDVAYWLEDIERFAVLYGKGTPSESQIAAVSDRFSEKCERESRCSSFSANDPFGVSGRCLDTIRRDDNGNIVLTHDQFSDLLLEINRLADVQMETGYALTTLAQAFRGIEAGVQYSRNDGAAFAVLAVEHAGRAIDNTDCIRGLFNEIKGN